MDLTKVKQLPMIYVAGPFTGKNPWDTHCNVVQAEQHAARVAKAGGVPLCPHTNTKNFVGIQTEEFWYNATMRLMLSCDAVFCCNVIGTNGTESPGTLTELKICEQLGIPVLRFASELAEYINAFDPSR